MRIIHDYFQYDKIISLLKEKGLTTQEAKAILKVEMEFLIYKKSVSLDNLMLNNNKKQLCRRALQTEYYQALKIN